MTNTVLLLPLKYPIMLNRIAVPRVSGLRQLFNNEGVDYEITENNLILINPSPEQLKSAAQEKNRKKITGVVRDQKGEPIIGANVFEKGTTNGTVTDIDGKYSLEVSMGSLLQISYIGYDSKEIKVGNSDVVKFY